MQILILKRDRLYADAIAAAMIAVLPDATPWPFSRALDALAFIKNHGVDLAILGVQTPDLDGIDHLPVFIGHPNVRRTLIVTTRRDSRTLLLIRQLNFHGFVDSRSADIGELQHAITTVLVGGRYLSPGNDQAMRQASTTSHVQRLTRREMLVLSVLGDGSDNAAAAWKLDTSEETVRTHRRNIMLKLDLRHKGELVQYALEHCFTRITSLGVLYPGFQKIIRRVDPTETNGTVETDDVAVVRCAGSSG